MRILFLSFLVLTSVLQGLLGETGKLKSAKSLNAGYFLVREENKEVTIWQYLGPDTSIVFPESINGMPVTGVDAFCIPRQNMWNKGSGTGTIPTTSSTSAITAPDESSDLTISLPSTIAHISDNAFLGCTNLSNINVASDNQIYTSCDGVLFSKDKKTLLTFPQSKQSSNYTIPEGTEIIDNAFFRCVYLTKILIPKSVLTIKENSLKRG